MSEQMTTEYKGFEIRFSEFEDAFVVSQDDYKSPSLKKCKERIDRITKESFERVNVIKEASRWAGEDYITAQVTSIEYDGQSVSAWVIDENKKRSKESILSLILDTPDAREKLKQAKALRAQADGIEKEASAIERVLPRYQPTIKDKAET